MFVATSVGNLHDAQPVARRYQPHRLGVDRDRSLAKRPGGQIFFMKMHGHGVGLAAKTLALNGRRVTIRTAMPMVPC